MPKRPSRSLLSKGNSNVPRYSQTRHATARGGRNAGGGGGPEGGRWADLGSLHLRGLRGDGGRVDRTSPGGREFARALGPLRPLGRAAAPRLFDPYARAADRIAARE